MPFGQMRTDSTDGAGVDGGTMVDGSVVEGTVVDGTVVDGTTVEGNVPEGVADGEMLGVVPTMLLPELALSIAGAGPIVLPNMLGGVPVTLGVGVTPVGGVVNPLGGVPTAPGVVVPAALGVVAAAPGERTWADAGNARATAIAMRGRRIWSSMTQSPCNKPEIGEVTQAPFRGTG